jgi:hypothetical protein
MPSSRQLSSGCPCTTPADVNQVLTQDNSRILVALCLHCLPAWKGLMSLAIAFGVLLTAAVLGLRHAGTAMASTALAG